MGSLIRHGGVTSFSLWSSNRIIVDLVSNPFLGLITKMHVCDARDGGRGEGQRERERMIHFGNSFFILQNFVHAIHLEQALNS